MSRNYKWFITLWTIIIGVGAFFLGIHTEQRALSFEVHFLKEKVTIVDKRFEEIINNRIWNIEQWIGRVNFPGEIYQPEE
jgi:hypothetical protein